MTAFSYQEPKPPAQLMREHIGAMRSYANELQNVLGFDNPVVKRIRSCAQTNELQLDRWERSAQAIEARRAGITEIGPVHESAVAKGDAP